MTDDGSESGVVADRLQFAQTEFEVLVSPSTEVLKKIKTSPGSVVPFENAVPINSPPALKPEMVKRLQKLVASKQPLMLDSTRMFRIVTDVKTTDVTP